MMRDEQKKTKTGKQQISESPVRFVVMSPGTVIYLLIQRHQKKELNKKIELQ